MKRTILIALVLLAVTPAIVWWWHTTREATRVAPDRAASLADQIRTRTAARQSSIAGTVREPTSNAIASAIVCAHAALHGSMTSEPTCSATDASGAYRLDGLDVRSHVVTASARGFRPARFAGEHGWLVVSEGETRTGVDFTLLPGGVEVSGTVDDVESGPIARARVQLGHLGPVVETDARGGYRGWVDAGMVTVTATAEDYATARCQVRAPATCDFRLFAESSYGGVVRDVSGSPVEDAYVVVAAVDPEVLGMAYRAGIASTDEHGRFRVKHLAPGRYSAVAAHPRGVGRSSESVLLRLGEHVDKIVVTLQPAHQIAGRVVTPDGKSCRDAWVGLRDDEHGRELQSSADSDAIVRVNGVLPGTYEVTVGCPGFVEQDRYPPIIVDERDVGDLVWAVSTGGTVEGKVTNSRGAAVEGIEIATDRFESALTDATGHYVLRGLRPGRREIVVQNAGQFLDPHSRARATLEIGETTIHRDFTFDDTTGSVTGRVTDPDGAPIRTLVTIADDGGQTYAMHSDAMGAFGFQHVPPGSYAIYAHVHAARVERRVTMEPNTTATVELVLAPMPTGTIRGRVVDARGAPVADAFVRIVPDHAKHPDLTSDPDWTHGLAYPALLVKPEGTFAASDLAIGSYAVRAFRPGGAAVIAHGVRTGATVELRLAETGAVHGYVTAGRTPVDELGVEVLARGPPALAVRAERFSRNGGRFAFRDVPVGRYALRITTPGGQQIVEVAITESADVAVDIDLPPPVAITGRLIDRRTRKPVARVGVTAQIRVNGISGTATPQVWSGPDGKFELPRVPRGPLELWVGGADDAVLGTTVERVVASTDPNIVDIGDVTVLVPKTGDGRPGFTLEQETPVARVAAIDASGPAAGSGLVVGDVITAVDGLESDGPTIAAMIAGPPGAPLELTLARGMQVIITLR